MPRVVRVMRRRRVLVPGRVVPRVMVVVGVQPAMILMSAPGLVGSDAAVVEPPGVPLAEAMPGRLRPLRRRDAAGAAAAAGAGTAAPRISRASLRPSRATMLAGGDGDGGAGRGCGRCNDDGLAARRRHGRCRHA